VGLVFRSVLTYGLVAGAIVGVPMFGMTIAMNGYPETSYSAVVGYSIMLVALSTVFVAIKRHRDEDLGGVIRFWPAFGLGLGISIVAAVIYVGTWEAASAVTHNDFAGGYARIQIERQVAKGVTGDALAKFTAEMEQFKVRYHNPLYRLPMTFAEIFPVGVLVSLVSAGLLRNRRFLPARR
jgi:hypothetical protein